VSVAIKTKSSTFSTGGLLNFVTHTGTVQAWLPCISQSAVDAFVYIQASPEIKKQYNPRSIRTESDSIKLETVKVAYEKDIGYLDYKKTIINVCVCVRGDIQE
jgi:hypothetical protein